MAEGLLKIALKGLHICFAVGQGGQLVQIDKLARHHERRHVLAEIKHDILGGRVAGVEQVQCSLVSPSSMRWPRCLI